MNPADPEVFCVHTAARSSLIKHHQLFALFKAPKWRRQRTDVHGLCCDVQEMGQDAADLRIQDADVARARRNGEFKEAFGREAEGVLLIHRGNIVKAIEIPDRLKVRLMLDQLFGTAMQESDMRVNALDYFAVQLQNEPEHAVRGRVLRTKVDVELAQFGFSHLCVSIVCCVAGE
ncbi:protein of unknown function [Candidatus Filomicrobium marinum]|nr:protein of unknown function [Candidatus Filomicrobium marinum]